MVTEIELFEPPDLTPFNVWLWSRKTSEIYERNVNRRDELLVCNLDAAANVKKREDQLRRTTHDLRKRLVKCTEEDGGIFEQSLRTVTNLSFPRHKFII